MDITCGLIKGRHKLSSHITEFVFDSDIPQDHICDSAYLEEICTAFIDKHPEVKIIYVYVTGFTPAMLALIKICSSRGVHLFAFNYDREKRDFWIQGVI